MHSLTSRHLHEPTRCASADNTVARSHARSSNAAVGEFAVEAERSIGRVAAASLFRAVRNLYPDGMRIHPRNKKLETESAFKVLARAQELEAEGKSIVHLMIGQPDFPTPKHICDAAIAAIGEGKTGYGPTPGLPALRQAIARDAGERRGIEFDPRQVIVTTGAKPIMLYTIQSLVGEGDEVIYPDPGFPMYRSLIGHSGATGVPLPIREERQFSFDRDEFVARVSDRTRLIILNYPHNPTGGTLDREDLSAVARVACEKDIVVLADEIYINFLYDGDFVSISTLPGMAERTIILDGFSKSYAMTGWRLGYGIVPMELAELFELYSVNIISCATTFNQYGGLAAITGPQDDVGTMVAEFKRRRDFLVAGLNRLPGVSCVTPGGAFYAFPNVKETGMSAEDLSRELLEVAGVAVLPGSAFGDAAAGYLRLSYATSMDKLEEGLRRMDKYLSNR